MTREQFITNLREYAKNFVPRVRPACAHFVSRAYKECLSATIPEINYVPNLEKYGIYCDAMNCKPGDMVIFDGTYDAVDPYGIGPEDTMTHVGIVTDWVDNTKMKFMHFSWSQDKPVEAMFYDMPSTWKIGSMRSMEKYFTDELSNKLIVKVVDSEGKSYDLQSIEMTMKFNGKVVKLFGHAK